MAAVAVEAPAAAPAGSSSAKSPPRLKNDKGKLTEAHGEPPLIIKRNENGHLTRGKMLGEGGFARVYAATDSLNGSTKAVKVISKEQLKSSKTKAKVSVADPSTAEKPTDYLPSFLYLAFR
jgi:serine/threonine protein kinase